MAILSWILLLRNFGYYGIADSQRTTMYSKMIDGFLNMWMTNEWNRLKGSTYLICLLLLCMCMWMACVWGLVHATVHMHRSENKIVK